MASDRLFNVLSYIRHLPRVEIANLKGLHGPRKKFVARRGQHGGRKCGRGNKGQGQRNTLPRVGFEGGNVPFYLIIPKEPYYFGHHMKRQFCQFSLYSLQRLIDMNRLDASRTVDLTSLCNTKAVVVDPSQNHYGVCLTDDGADEFKARVSIEVQYASEQAIAAVEKAGGSITTRFYDMACVRAMISPKEHFKNGLIIPRCKLPPEDLLQYYMDPINRGYLSEPAKIMTARVELSQKYGYQLPDITKDSWLRTILSSRKDSLQLWFGLKSGWAVNMSDGCILKPTNEHC